MSAAAWKALLSAELDAAGSDAVERVEDGKIAAQLDLIWDLHSDKASFELQYYYAKRQIIQFWLAQNWREVTTDEVVKEQLSDKAKALQAMLDSLDDGKGGGLLRELESKLNAASGSAVGSLTASIGTGPGASHPAGWPW